MGLILARTDITIFQQARSTLAREPCQCFENKGGLPCDAP